MSRFADTRATRRIDLGACGCPGTPHPSDWIDVRASLSGSEITELVRLPALPQQGQAETAARYVVAWNLLDADGEVDISGDAIYALDNQTAAALGGGLAESIKESTRLPNPSGAPSPASPRGSASRTRTRTPKPGT